MAEQMYGPGPTGHLKPLHAEDFTSALDRQVARTRAADAPDLRTEARRKVDRVHEGMRADTLKEFGRSPSMDSSRQVSDRVAFLLTKAQAAESAYIDTASRGGAAEHVEELWEKYTAAFVAWLNAATAGWPSAKAASRRLDDDLRTGIGSRAGFRTGSGR